MNPLAPTCGHGCGRCNGWDDLPGDELGLELVHFLNPVVASPHVREARDEVHVVVAVHILLKGDGVQLVPLGQLPLSLLQGRKAVWNTCSSLGWRPTTARA